MSLKTPPTLRFQLICLVAVSMLPIWLVSGILLFQAYTTKRDQLNESMLDTARFQATLVDQELARVQAVLLAFATSSSFDTADFGDLHRRSQQILELYPGADIIVADATGQQLLNSFRPYGTPLPKRKNPETVRKIFETGKPVISDLFYGALTRRPLIGIDVPVIRDGKVLYDLAMTFSSDRIAAILQRRGLPTDSYCSILDSSQILVARSLNAQRYVGRGVNPSLRQAIIHAPEGILEVDNNFEGKPVFDIFSRSAMSGWSVVVGIPKTTVMAGIYRWIGWTFFGVTVISLFGVVLSLVHARRIAQAIHSLIDPALSIGRGEPVVVADTSAIKETSEVASALVKASELIQNSNEKLRESERHYSALFANRINGIAHCRVITDELGSPVDYWILQVNDAYEQIIGIKREEIEGRRVRDVFPGVENFEFDYIGVLGRIALEGGEIKAETFLESTRQFFSIYAYSPTPGEFTVILSDVTENKQIELNLRKSELLFRTLSFQAPVGIFQTDPDGNCIYVNNIWCQLAGIKKDEAMGAGWANALHPEDRDRVVAEWNRAFCTHLPFSSEFRFMTPTGTVSWISGVASKLSGDSSELSGYVGCLSNITDRKRTEEALQQSEERYRAVVEDQTETICRYTTDGTYTFVNDVFCRIFGKTREELLGSKWYPDAFPEDMPIINEQLSHLSSSNPVVVVENRILSSTGEVRWMQFVNRGFFDAEGRHVETQAVGRDITERKNLELKLAESELKYRTLVMNAPFLVTNVDRGGVISFINRCTEGFNFQSVIGTSSFDYLDGDSKEIYRDALEKVFQSRSPQRMIVKGFGDNHSLNWFETVLGPIVTDGNVVSVIQVSIDITERKRAEEALAMSKVLLEHQVQERTASLSYALEQLSHENEERKRIEQDLLDNQRKLEAMSIELSLAEERERDRIAGELHDQVGQRLIFSKMVLGSLASHATSDESSAEIEQLDNIIDLSIQDIRSLAFQLRPPLLASAGLEAALHWLGEEFHEKYGLQFTCSDDGQAKPLRYEARSTIFQAAREILLNTVKHANATHIGISIKRDSDMIRLSVSDNGCGFDVASSKVKTSKTGGFGLQNVKRRIEYLGGNFTIESNPGFETCATIVAPLDKTT
ncbi:MAG: PAS domain S-box protein [Desulfuromonadales bacterium]|nr:PAS domain S-box protein [Desulfuromonadales bacterium]